MNTIDMDILVGDIRRGNLEAVQNLLVDAPTVNIQVDGITLLFVATFKQRLDIMEYLLSRGADPNLRNEEDYETPLILARRRNDTEAIRLLTTPKNKLVSKQDFLKDLESVTDLIESLSFDQASLKECTICYDDQEMKRLERCGHECCLSCLGDYLKHQVDKFTTVPVVRCFTRNCKQSISLKDMTNILSLTCPEVLSKYQDRLFLASLTRMEDFQWCTKCEYGGLTPSTASSSTCRDVQCTSCSHVFCAECREEGHPEMTCSEKYKQVMSTDLTVTEKQSAKLIRQSSKPCPQCLVNTERSAGCSHMSCSMCKFQWCWLCGNEYKGRYTFSTQCPCGS